MSHRAPAAENKGLVRAPQDAVLPGNKPDIKQQAALPAAGSVNGVSPDAPVPAEIGGREGPEPTRFGDWEKAGRCIDF